MDNTNRVTSAKDFYELVNTCIALLKQDQKDINLVQLSDSLFELRLFYVQELAKIGAEVQRVYPPVQETYYLLESLGKMFEHAYAVQRIRKYGISED
jgi:uncharacterized membrane protein SirB2